MLFFILCDENCVSFSLCEGNFLTRISSFTYKVVSKRRYYAKRTTVSTTLSSSFLNKISAVKNLTFIKILLEEDL